MIDRWHHLGCIPLKTPATSLLTGRGEAGAGGVHGVLRQDQDAPVRTQRHIDHVCRWKIVCVEIVCVDAIAEMLAACVCAG